MEYRFAVIFGPPSICILSQVVPDIVTIGKPLGNGHPMGAVICSRDVSSKLGGYFSTFGGNPVSCAAGIALVLSVPKFNANLHCICFSIDLRYLKQMQYRFAVNFGRLSISYDKK